MEGGNGDGTSRVDVVCQFGVVYEDEKWQLAST